MKNDCFGIDGLDEPWLSDTLRSAEMYKCLDIYR